MTNNLLGLLLSYVLVFVVIGLSTLLQKKGILKEEGARKFIHIGVSNWWILAMLFFDNVWFAIIPPISFIILNYASYKMNLIKSMERNGNGNLGTVYFPISLLILVIVSFGLLNQPEVGAIGILILGYGDGFAAVIGQKFGKHKLKHNKTLEGSLAMFVASLVVAFIIIHIYHGSQAFYLAPIIALIATVVELYTPKGIDNLSVPLINSAIYYSFLLII